MMSLLTDLGSHQQDQQPSDRLALPGDYCSLEVPRPNRSDSQLAKGTVALVLAGGRGARLHQLTDWRAKPAVPFGGKFRIIDFALSNCVNSGIRRIGIATQYKAQSLIRHVQRGWSFLDGRFDEFVELLPAQQRVEPNWYEGTADAVYQNIDILRRHGPEHVLILAGDHVYKMNYGRMLADHVESRADFTMACIEVPRAAATSFGVVEADRHRRVRGFVEKPAQPPALAGHPDRALASMGVYVARADFLYEQLIHDADAPGSTRDFGHDLIPYLTSNGAHVHAHDFAASCVNAGAEGPYWRDVGTVDAYWNANMELTKVVPELNLYDADWPIWTYHEQLPPAKFVFDDPDRRGHAIDSLVSSGCIVSGSVVRHSVLFSNVRVHDYCEVEHAVVLPQVEIGPDVHLRRVVIDKHCRIPPGLRIGFDAAADRRRFHVTPGGVTLVVPEMLGQRIHHQR